MKNTGSRSQRRYNVWPYLREHTGINPWKAEERILKTMEYASKAQFKQGEVTVLDFSKMAEGAFGVTMTWTEGRAEKHDLELTSVVIRDRWPRIRKYFNGLTPVYAVDIIVDGESVINKEDKDEAAV